MKAHKRSPRPAAASRRRDRRGLLAHLALVSLAGLLASGLLASTLSAAVDPAATTTAPSCPASNPPDELTLAGGSPQTAKLDSPFAAPFQVTLANSNGCPVTATVAGTQITFSAPANGSSTATGSFAASGTSSVTVGVDATGNASAPSFTANDIEGSYTLTASSSYGSVSFSLTNTAAGIAATLTPQVPLSQAAFTGAEYHQPLQVLVLDENGNPVEGAAVSFSLGSSGGGGAGAGADAASSAGATFLSGETQATVSSNASGLATSPLFTADDAAGSFSATAATAGVTEPATFKLDNVPGKPPELTLIGNARRSAQIDSRYGAPLQVKVVDAAGEPLEGATVTFSLGSSSAGANGAGAAGSAGGAGASFLGGSSEATETTGPRGIATSPFFSANGTPGTFTATVAVSGRTNPLLVTLDNIAGKPPTLEILGAARGSATVGSRYRHPLEVKVIASDGEPLEGATVTFSLGSSSAGANGAGAAGSAGGAGASFLGGSSEATETTGPRGIATSPFFSANGTPGTFTATVAVSGRTNPLLVTLDNIAGKPPTLEILGAARGSATVGSRYRHPLEVKVIASDGQPLEGTTVTFALGASSAAAGGGAAGSAGASFLSGVGQETEITNANGVAVSPAFTANGTAGAFSATASIAGVANPAMFALDNLAAKPPAIRSSGSDPSSATVGGRYRSPLRVIVVAADGKPVEGTTVTFTLGSASAGGGTAGASGAGATFVGGSSEATETTNADGRAVSPAFTANTVTGSFTATASISGTTAVESFPLRNLAATPATITVGAAANEQTTAGTRFPIRLAVTVKDKDGNVVKGAVVTFSAPTAGATGRFAATRRADTRVVRVRTDSEGIAVAPPFAAGHTPGGYVVTATVKGAGAAAFALVNQAPGQ